MKRSGTFDFKICGMLPLPKVKWRRFAKLDKLLSSRQSRRDFRAPLSMEELGEVLWHTSRARAADAGGRQHLGEQADALGRGMPPD